MKVLILCTGNSCRSQMAEGFLQALNPRLVVRSAGTNASGMINQGAVRVMAEVGIDISAQRSESVDLYLDEDWDYVITVCGGAKEICPIFQGNVKHQLHIGFDDPSDSTGTQDFIDGEYVRVRDEIAVAFRDFYMDKIKPQL